MGCNYYIHTKDADMIFDLRSRFDIDGDAREFVVHICKTNIGWKPLFECNGYHSFQELTDILCNSEYEFTIKDQYGREYGKEEFISYMRRRNETGNSQAGTENDPDNIITIDDDGFEFMDCRFD